MTSSFSHISEDRLSDFVKSIELRATKILEGLQPSRRSGSGIEFHSAQAYTQGEEVRFIDWKRYAASDRLYIRRFERQERTGFAFGLDRSESMQYGSKAEWAKAFAASLIWIARGLGDSWRILGEDVRSVEEAVEFLVSASPQADWQNEVAPEAVRLGDRLILISDFFFDPKILRSVIEDMQDRQHQIVLVQVLDPTEATFNFEGVCEFRDLEGPHKLLLDAELARKHYLRELHQLQVEWKSLLKPGDLFFSFSAELKELDTQLWHFFEELQAEA